MDRYSQNPQEEKQIEVDSVLEENSLNGAFVALECLIIVKTKIMAKVSIDKGGVKKESVTVREGSNLYTLSNDREIYRNGYIIKEIDATHDYIAFYNGDILYQEQQKDDLNDEIMS